MSASAEPAWTPYCGAAPVPENLFGQWNADPALLLALATIFAVFWRNTETQGQRSLLTLAAASSFILFVSPFCALSSALFSARVTHHVILAAILAPLLIYSLPARRTRWPGSLPVWTAVQAAVFWFWHAPSSYAEALSSDVVYWTMQLTIAGTALGFWAAVRRASSLSAVAALLVSTVQMGLLGALITFAGAPLYAPHLLTSQPWGLTALEDQQVAGLIMWAPSAGLYLAAALLIAQRWFAREEHEAAA